VRVIATSREPLGVPGETAIAIDPLAPADAHRLFVDRAARRKPGFVPREEDDAAIAVLCARVDRLPLGIELAAARISAMAPTEIAVSLEERSLELGGGRREGAPHHRTMRATIDWSYQLLEPAEQRGLRALGVFVGSFVAAAATAVAPEVDTSALVRLVDKSLVTVVDGPSGPTRYRLLETVRQLAEERLVDAGEADDARARRLRHFEARCEPTVGWPSPGGERTVAALEDDYGNVRAALDWAATHDACAGIRLLAATADLFSMVGHADGWRLANLLLERCGERDRSRALVLVAAGVLGFMQGVPDAAQARLAEAVELSAELGDAVLGGWATFFQGLSAVTAGRVEIGHPRLAAAQATFDESGDRVGWARATAVLGLAALIDDDLDGARALVDDALAAFTAEGDRWGQGLAHTYLGIVDDRAGDEAGATHHNRTAVECFGPFRDTALLPSALASQAGVLARRDPVRGLKVVAAARALKTRDGGDFPPFFKARADHAQELAEAALGPEAAGLWKEGSGLSRDDAIALAFGTTVPRRTAVSGLSEREQEVARLVADGLANKTIAAQLHLSVRTVESHVRHVLVKLGLTNRTQLATWVRERL
jgi:non-specific serine/threonine protein kinase